VLPPNVKGLSESPAILSSCGSVLEVLNGEAVVSAAGVIGTLDTALLKLKGFMGAELRAAAATLASLSATNDAAAALRRASRASESTPSAALNILAAQVSRNACPVAGSAASTAASSELSQLRPPPAGEFSVWTKPVSLRVDSVDYCRFL